VRCGHGSGHALPGASFGGSFLIASTLREARCPLPAGGFRVSGQKKRRRPARALTPGGARRSKRATPLVRPEIVREANCLTYVVSPPAQCAGRSAERCLVVRDWGRCGTDEGHATARALDSHRKPRERNRGRRGEHVHSLAVVEDERTTTAQPLPLDAFAEPPLVRCLFDVPGLEDQAGMVHPPENVRTGRVV